MAGRIKMSFHWRVFIAVLALSWTLTAVFVVFQFSREKDYKRELLDARLQTYNSALIDGLARGLGATEAVAGTTAPMTSLRVTVIDGDGKVVYDNNDATPFPVDNHNARPEVVQARANGRGNSSERHSANDNVDYFYSATLAPDGETVVRSAAQYTHSLEETLRADRSLLWTMLLLTAVVSAAAYFVTRRISQSIMRLNRFAEKAERGEGISDDEAFPRDELGSIAGHIVKLYVQREERHRRLLEEERDKIRLKKQLTNNINHELKTPVTSMLVCIDILRDRPDLPEEKRREFERRLEANARRLSALLSDVSTLTRMDEGQNMISKEELDISELVEDIAAEMRLRTDISIVVKVPSRRLRGNRRLLESVFRNLFENALSYSGGSEIRVVSDKEGNFVFSDNGCGVPEEHLPHIFERFYRIDKGRSRASGGTGLGLSIVRNAIAIHGGTITARNTPGLTFEFTLG